ncbi:hypothetical protein [Campylobacter sp.]|uniref:hypothetical protein n=1 Tax=Campylobacter sp. TaxID=205 RepID=UPI002AA72DE9|nr:hypothetical protein [Campylobacter sp.]MCI7236487.1 hypothetical protein [Campylobacter sp.]
MAVKIRLQDCEAIFENFGAGLAVGHRIGSVCENFRRIFQGDSRRKTAKIFRIRCWAVQAKILKKRPQAEPANK